MSDTDRKLPFFFSIAFILGGLTTILFASPIVTSLVYGGNVLLPSDTWQQAILTLLFIFICTLLFFTSVFFILATLCGIVELRFQNRKLRQMRVPPFVSRHSVNQHTSLHQQRRSGY